MKILFQGFGHPESLGKRRGEKRPKSIMLDREINELQQAFGAASGEPVESVFLPDSNIERFPLEIINNEPDIVHISAHGGKKLLVFKNGASKVVEVNARQLRSFFDQEKTPRLVYINACSSFEIARELRAVVPYVVGTSAPIENYAAWSSARLFYERLLAGSTIGDAFRASKSLLECNSDDNNCTSFLYWQPQYDPNVERLHVRPRLVATFHRDKMTPDRERHFKFRVGVIGCPRSTEQVVVFTTDETFDQQDPSNLEEDLCFVIREKPTRGVLWCGDPWRAYGDFPIFATVVFAGNSFSISSTLYEALEAHLAIRTKKLSKAAATKFRNALGILRKNDGANIDGSEVNSS